MRETENYGKGVEDYLTSLFFIRKVKSYFVAMDVTHDGYLSIDDYEIIAARIIENQVDITEEEAEKIRNIWRHLFKGIMAGNKPCDKNTKVSYEEFLINCANVFYHREETRENLRVSSEMIFDYVDTNKDGTISFEEYTKYQEVYFGKDRTAASEVAFASLDRNHDGVISRDEFVTAQIDYCFEAFGDESTSVLPFGPLMKL